MKLQKEEYILQQKWQAQEEEYAEFIKMKSVEGWIANTVTQTSACGAGMKLKNPEKPDDTRSVDKKRQAAKEEAEVLKRRVAEGQPEKGLQHLKRIGVLPDYGVEGAHKEVSVKNLPRQDSGKVEPWDHLSLRGDTGKGMLVDKDEAQCEKGDGKLKIKSGKFAKSHTDLVKEESWPHLNVLRQYSRRTSFDQMDFEAFVAGETRVIGAMWGRNEQQAKGRLKVLCRIAHWMCKCKDWCAVRNIYKAIIESMEMGEAEWWHSFDSYESLLPPAASILEKLRKDDKWKDKEKDKDSKKTPESFWCKDYQKGLCSESSPHQLQLKPDEKPVSVLHMCALCYQKDKKKRDHPEGDPGCPHKKQ